MADKRDSRISPNTWCKQYAINRAATIGRPPGAPQFIPPQARPQQPREPTGPPQPATGPGFQESRFEDGRTLTFWVADLASGKASKVWQEPLGDESYRTLRSIDWAGDSLVFRAERNNWQHYHAVAVSGGLDAAPVDLTPGEGEAEFVGLSPDGKFLYYSANTGDIDRRDVWRTPTSGGTPAQLTKGEGLETYPAPLASGTKVAVLYADSRRAEAEKVCPSLALL